MLNHRLASFTLKVLWLVCCDRQCFPLEWFMTQTASVALDALDPREPAVGDWAVCRTGDWLQGVSHGDFILPDSLQPMLISTFRGTPHKSSFTDKRVS